MSVIDKLLELLYPPRCAFCSKLLKDSEHGICRKCNLSITPVQPAEYRRDIKNIELCIAPFYYKDKVRESLHRYKFSGASAYGRVYSEFIVKSIDESGIFCDIISWVPLHRRRLRKRGYDQAEIIARGISKELGIPCKRLLVKTKNNKQQSLSGGAEQRRANVAGVYKCVCADLVKGKTVLLVDDILTTGATVSECASVLKDAGCDKLYAAAAAMRVL